MQLHASSCNRCICSDIDGCIWLRLGIDHRSSLRICRSICVDSLDQCLDIQILRRWHFCVRSKIDLGIDPHRILNICGNWTETVYGELDFSINSCFRIGFCSNRCVSGLCINWRMIARRSVDEFHNCVSICNCLCLNICSCCHSTCTAVCG